MLVGKSKKTPRKQVRVPDPSDGALSEPYDFARVGEQYAWLAPGLLDPVYPHVTFVVELPFPMAPVPEGLADIIIPMSGMRTGEREDSEVRVRLGSVVQDQITGTAPLKYLKSLPGRTGREYELLQQTGARGLRRTKHYVALAELTTANRMPDAPDVSDPSGRTEAAVGLFNRCLDGLNRLLTAYVIATEDPAVRPLSPEALGFYSVVEFRNDRREPAAFAGMLTLPRSTTPATFNSLRDEDLIKRLVTAMANESVRHPMNVVVLWEARALHYSRVVGDYEMSLLALNISAEVLLDAVRDTHRVDDGHDSSLYDKPDQFAATLKAVTADFGEPWLREQNQGPWAQYVRDCYEIRNETTHEGRHVSSEELDGALLAYYGLRRTIERLTLATAQCYPRTALLVHGPVGMQKAKALTGRVAEELAKIQGEGSLAFWLPPDLR